MTLQPRPTLAILTPRWGAASETFVRRHLTLIAPGRTVAMTRDVLQSDWCQPVTLLPIKNVAGTPLGRLARALGCWRLDRRSCALRRFLVEQQVATVMGEWLNFSAGWYSSLQGLKLPFFAHAHGYDITAKKINSYAARLAYRRLRAMAGIITVSEAGRQRLLAAFSLNPSRVHVIPCGVDVPAECPVRPATAVVTCVSVGRMVAKKNPLATLNAFRLARKNAPQLRLEFIGDGPLLEPGRRFCDENGLSTFVKFHGVQSPAFVQAALQRADLFALHSVTARNGDEEGLPVAILEAMAQGLPVVSTRHAGIPEAVVEGATGWLVTEGDFETMGQRLQELATQPRVRQEMGNAGWARASKQFTLESEIRQLQALLFGAKDIYPASIQHE